MAPIPPELSLTVGERVRNDATARGRSWRWVAVQPERTVTWDNHKLGSERG